MSSDPHAEKPHTKDCSYTKPEAEYQEILQNPDIFLQKLKAFHSFYGTKFRIPTMGGNRLDLHLLFVEVTSRGGIEKVLRDRRWKEITEAFKFPSSITNASFVLRKYYLSLIYHFEQIYYLRKEEPSISVSASKSSHGFTLSRSLNGAASNQFLASPNLDDSSLVTGTIDGKFDDGYLITVSIKSTMLNKKVLVTILESYGAVFRMPKNRYIKKGEMFDTSTTYRPPCVIWLGLLRRCLRPSNCVVAILFKFLLLLWRSFVFLSVCGKEDRGPKIFHTDREPNIPGSRVG